jgi:thiol-disulfide isomerase/thioredoxin
MRQLAKVLPWMAVLAGAAGAQPSTATRPADQLVAEALLTAKAQHKIVMVDFGSSWCGWCHRLDRFLADTGSAGRIMRDNFVVAPITVLETEAALKDKNNPGGDTLLTHYQGKTSDGIPFFAFLDANGQLLGTSNAMPDGSNIGHPDKDDEIVAFDKLLRSVAPAITDEQRATISRHLVAMRPPH